MSEISNYLVTAAIVAKCDNFVLTRTAVVVQDTTKAEAEAAAIEYLKEHRGKELELAQCYCQIESSKPIYCVILKKPEHGPVITNAAGAAQVDFPKG